MAHPVICLAALLTWAGAAAAQTPMSGTAPSGRALFYSRAASSNGLACILCHSDFDETRTDDGLIRPGHTLYNAAFRETWWGQEPDDPDRYPDIAHAAVFCVEHYMQNPQKLTAQQLLDLQAYLSAITKRPNRDALPIAAAADKTGEYAGFDGGDRIGGRELFYAACHSCHPNGNAGISATAIPRDRPPAFYARKVREGDGLGAVFSGVDPNGYDPGSGLFMPFFTSDRLSDQQLRDTIAFMRSLPPAPSTPTAP